MARTTGPRLPDLAHRWARKINVSRYTWAWEAAGCREGVPSSGSLALRDSPAATQGASSGVFEPTTVTVGRPRAEIRPGTAPAAAPGRQGLKQTGAAAATARGSARASRTALPPPASDAHWDASTAAAWGGPAGWRGDGRSPRRRQTQVPRGGLGWQARGRRGPASPPPSPDRGHCRTPRTEQASRAPTRARCAAERRPGPASAFRAHGTRPPRTRVTECSDAAPGWPRRRGRGPAHSRGGGRSARAALAE